jgi:hypothetical protein
MPVYHFSEDPSIEIFIPRAPLRHPESEPLVYAIDEEHAPLYWLPRDCPRVCWWPISTTFENDKLKWMPNPGIRMVIAIEDQWLERALAGVLYRYDFDPEGFIETGDHGVYLTRQPVRPLSVHRLVGPARAMRGAGVELRVLPSLVELGHEILNSTLHVSMIRMDHAHGWDLQKGKPVRWPRGSA